MDLEGIKFGLQNELKEPTTDVHKPLCNKYASWKIIDYLWVCHIYKQELYEYKNWLLNLYKDEGMTEDESNSFSSEIDLIVGAIERCPFKSNK